MRVNDIVARVADLVRECDELRAQNAKLQALLDAQVHTPADPVSYGAPLTPAPTAIMDLLRSSPDIPFSRHQLLRALPFHAHGQHPGEGVVDAHVCNIRKKLGDDAIETIGGRGTGRPFLGYRLGAKYRREAAKAAAE